MIIQCFRCDKGIDAPNSKNADYVIAEDTIVREPRETLVALKHNQATLDKAAKMKETNPDGTPKYPELTIADNEYDEVEVPYMEAAKSIGEDLIKVMAEVRQKDIQKTGIVCPGCYRDTDFVIWGIHKSAQ